MKGKGIFRCATVFLFLMLFSFSFAASTSETSTTAGDAYRLWDRTDVGLNPDYYSDMAVTVKGIYGVLKTAQMNNTFGGPDVTVKLYDDGANLLYSKVVQAGTNYYNRSLENYSIFGWFTIVVTNNWTSGGSMPVDHLVSWHRMDQGDENHTDPTVGSTPLYFRNSELGTGKIFNGTSLVDTNATAWINYSDSYNLSRTDGFSVSMWLSLNGVVNKSWIVHQGANSTSDKGQFGIQLNEYNGSYYVSWLLIRNTTNFTLNYTLPAALYGGAFAHWVFVYNGSATMNESRIYVNGVSVANATMPGDVLAPSTANFTFGDGLNITYWANMSMDELYWFNSSLTSAQVVYLYGQRNGTRVSVMAVSKR
ncbi:MAG: LamG domain-containing protein [Candidatus Micrarchaeia archaeon]